MTRRPLPFLALALVGCALSHERADVADAAAADAGPPSDASSPVDATDDPCARGRSESVILPPAARQPGFSILLMRPHVSTEGDRIAVSAEVLSDRQGGIGNSDILTYDAAGGAPRAFFTTELPYVLGTATDLDAYLGSGGFAAGRVYGENLLFAGDRFEIFRSDDAEATPDAPQRVPLAPGPAPYAIFEMAREGPRAVRFDDHRGVIVYDVTPEGLTEERVIPIPEGLALLGPLPRLSPSGRTAIFRRGADARVLTTLDTATGAMATHLVPSDVGAVAALDDTSQLILPRRASDAAHPLLLVLSLLDDSVTALDLGLPVDASSTDHIFDTIDVGGDGATFVTAEEQGRRLRVIRCDPQLRALSR